MPVDNTPHRTPDLWFEDGNIVLQAENSQFRVHRGILVACSPVFQNMLSFPQPPDSELVEGCPIVQLADSSEEVDIFLKALFKPNYFMPFPAPTEYTIIRGCLRLGNKYGVDHLRIRALVHLSSRYRTSLSEWESRDLPRSDCAAPPGKASRPVSQIVSWGTDKPGGNCEIELSVIPLAREVGALWVLPTAFLFLSAVWGSNLSDPTWDSTFDSVQASLSPSDLKVFLKGYSRQTQASTTITMLRSLVDPATIPLCLNPGGCFSVRMLAATDYSVKLIEFFPSYPLIIWTRLRHRLTKARALCSVCVRTLDEAQKAARQEFWDKLPSMYELPPWEELEKMKVEAMGTSWLS